MTRAAHAVVPRAAVHGRGDPADAVSRDVVTQPDAVVTKDVVTQPDAEVTKDVMTKDDVVTKDVVTKDVITKDVVTKDEGTEGTDEEMASSEKALSTAPIPPSCRSAASRAPERAVHGTRSRKSKTPLIESPVAVILRKAPANATDGGDGEGWRRRRRLNR